MAIVVTRGEDELEKCRERLKECRECVNGLAVVAILLMLACMVGVPVAWQYGKNSGRTEEQQQAARGGVGEYVFDSKTGYARFRYVLPALPEDFRWVHAK